MQLINIFATPRLLNARLGFKYLNKLHRMHLNNLQW